jgi:hypothetical protein
MKSDGLLGRNRGGPKGRIWLEGREGFRKICKHTESLILSQNNLQRFVNILVLVSKENKKRERRVL